MLRQSADLPEPVSGWTREPVRWRRLPIRFPLMGLAAAVGLVVTYLGFIRTYVGQSVDQLGWTGGPVTSSDMRFGGGLLEVAALLAVVVGVAAVIVVAVRRRAFSLLVGAAVLVGGSMYTTETLKLRVLARPLLTDITGAGAYNTFPSGHTTMVASVTAALLLVTPTRWRGVVGVPCGLFATGIGVWTLHAGWHRTSDAVGAYLVVMAWLAAVIGAMLVLRRRPARPQRVVWWRDGFAPLFFAGVAAVTGLLAASRLWSTIRVVRTTRDFTVSQLNAAYRGGTLVVIAMASLTWAVCLWAMRGVDVGGPVGADDLEPDRTDPTSGTVSPPPG